MRGFALAALLAACASAGPPAPKGPSPVVRADIASAEVAELARHHDVARAQYERAIAEATDPKSEGFARREYANTLASWGEVPAAIAQLERAVLATPADPRPWQDLGVLRSTRDDVPGARAALEHAKALVPDKYPPRVALAALLWHAGDRAGALAEYRGLAALELPDRLRTKVQWAIETLAKPSGP